MSHSEIVSFLWGVADLIRDTEHAHETAALIEAFRKECRIRAAEDIPV